jgi:glucose/arabinose dehydrogenase
MQIASGLAFSLGAMSALAAPTALNAGDWPFTTTPKATLSEPWAMTFLPDGTALITEKRGALKHVDVKTGKAHDITGVPDVAYGGQGGLGDVILHPEFEQNNHIYLSYAEQGENGDRGAAVARATLSLDGNGGGSLSQVQVIWRQTPKVSGGGHYGHRMAFGPDKKLWISSGERQKFKPAQDMGSNLGKIVRVNDDGSLPPDNPFADQGGVAAQIWALGVRNPLGIAFDAQGRLWEQEMGPQGGDELNLIQRGGNYGYPEVSNGDHYGGRPIPDHSTRPEFVAPKITWTPVISPAGLMIYDADLFSEWKGNAFIGGLSSESLVRITFNGEDASEAERYAMGARIREVEQGPDGAIWLLEDGSGGRLLELRPK